MLTREANGQEPARHYGYGYTIERDDTLQHTLALLLKRKRLILLTFLSIAGLVTIVTFLLPPVYRSHAAIYVEREFDPEKAFLLGFNAQLPYEKLDWLNSESEILQSQPVAERVIRDLKLNEVYFKGTPKSEAEKAKSFERTVKQFQRTIKVETPRNSNIIDIAYEAKDPRLAAAVVSHAISTYADYRAQVFADSVTPSFFEQQMKITGEQVSTLEKRQTEFKRSSELVSPQAQTTILVSKLADYQRSLTETQTQRIGKAAKLKIIREQYASGQILNIPTTESSNSLSREKYIGKLKGDLLDMEVRRDQLLRKFTPEYEEVVTLTAQIEGTRKSIRREVEQIIEEEQSNIRVLEAQERALQNAIASINQDVRNMAENEYQLSELSRGIEDNKAVYSMLLKQREEARISQARAQHGIKIRIVTPATVPVEPVKPRKLFNIAMGILLGLACGIGLAFSVEYYARSLKSYEEFQRYLGMPATPVGELPQGDRPEIFPQA